MNTLKNNKKLNWLPWLDGLRGFSILLVILSHFFKNTFPHEPLISWICPLGRAGVSLFFVISGFIITSGLLAEKIKENQISLKAFYQRRIFRIFPCAFLYLSAYWLWQFFDGRPIQIKEFLAVLILAAGIWKVTTWFTGHFWSLCVEEQFYLVMPAFLQTFGVGALRKGCLFVVMMAPLLRTALYFTIGNQLDSSIFWVLDSLAVGVFISIWYRNGHPLPRIGNGTGLLLASIVLVAGALSFEGTYGKVTVPFGGTILAAFSAYLILLGLDEKNKGLIQGLLNYRPLIQIGKCSYSLYLFQQLFLPPAEVVSAWWQRSPFNLVGIIVLSGISYLFWETPWRNLGKRLASKNNRTQLFSGKLENALIIEDKGIK